MNLKDAKALLKEDDDLIIAVYDYWLNKRVKVVSTRFCFPFYTQQQNEFVLLFHHNCWITM